MALASSAAAKEFRVALWHAPFTRDGPGLLLRDIQQGDALLVGLVKAIATADADIVVLTRFDYDASGQTLRAFASLVDGGHDFVYALRSNAGVPTGLDLDGDGRVGEPEDAQAFGLFPGQEALAVLSRFPILDDHVTSFNDILWRDLPGGLMTAADHGRDVQRLSSGGHWIVPIEVQSRGQTHPVHVLLGHADPPVFDGPEDRNGRRNRDELRLWETIISETEGPFLFMANTNLDPERGDGYRAAMGDILANSRFADPLPGQVTAHWASPGSMRVSYVLPSMDFGIVSAQIWPLVEGQQHSLITVDLTLPDAGLP